MKAQFLILLLALTLLVACTEKKQNPTVSSGQLIRVENFESKFITPRNIDIWLPDNYSSAEPFSVLYMHDGQMLFDSTNTWNKQEWGVDETMGKLLKQDQIQNTIVVGIWNGGKTRYIDYFPQKPYEDLRERYDKIILEDGNDFFDTKMKSDAYLRFLVEELKPYIDSNYKTNDLAYTAGSSMGGLISIYALCEYPNVFFGAACLSTHWVGLFRKENNPVPDAFTSYLENNLPEPNHHKIYFDYGTHTLDSLYEEYQVQVDSVMIRKGFDQQYWKTMKFEGHDHSERSWKKRLSIPFRFLLAKEVYKG